METVSTGEAPTEQISTPYQLADGEHGGVYFRKDIDEAAANLYDIARRTSISPDGKVDKTKLRGQFDTFATAEVGDDWEAAEKSYRFYGNAVDDDLPSTQGAYKACMEMRRAHLKKLVKTAPVSKKIGYVTDFIGFTTGIFDLVK